MPARATYREEIGRPRQESAFHSDGGSRIQFPSWYFATSTIEPKAGRTASHRGQRYLYRLRLGPTQNPTARGESFRRRISRR